MVDNNPTGSSPEHQLREKMIEHLSADVIASTQFLTSHRIRMSFSVLVGPFIVLGSFLIATKGTIASNGQDWVASILVVAAAGGYVGIGCVGYLIDQHTLNQCNRWRQEIARLCSGESLSHEGEQFHTGFKTGVRRYYLIAFLVILGTFALITVVCFRILATCT